MIKVNVKLVDEKLSGKLLCIVRARNIAVNDAVKVIKKHTGCDEVLTSRCAFGNTNFHIGFKSKIDNPIYKKQKEIFSGYYVHNPKVKTDEYKILCDEAKKVNEIPDLNKEIKKIDKVFDRQILGDDTSRGCYFCFASFGMRGGVVYGTVPFGNDEEIKLPKGWVEITASEMQAIQR